MLTPVPLPDFRDSARALMHDLPRLRAAINEAKVLLSALRGECTCPAPDPRHRRCVQRWRAHSACRMWEGAEAGLYLLREEYRAAYAEATDGVKWGKDAREPWTHVIRGAIVAKSAILPAWWGDEVVHSSHRAALLGKWHEDIKNSASLKSLSSARGRWNDGPSGWREFAARRLPGGSWPYAWPLPCATCDGKGEVHIGLTFRCFTCEGKGYTLRVGPRGATER